MKKDLPRLLSKAILIILILAGTPFGQSADRPDPLGFTSERGVSQLREEALLSNVPSARSAERHHRILTEEPHVAGQPAQRELAEYLMQYFAAQGIPGELVEYQVYLPYPKAASLSLTEPLKVELDLSERVIPGDKDTYARDVIPPFNAYSPSGTVESQVVYVNYGLPEDYLALENLGIDVKDKIVLARYGRSFRGVKIKVAQDRGAAAVLLYSDPRDDGYFGGDIYPVGPMRPPSAVQRGSVQYLFVYPGDPLTPGVPAVAEAERMGAEQAGNLPKIPSQPLSYENARLILEHLGGPTVPDESWQGGLPFAYHLGPGEARVKLSVEMDYQVRPIWNVIGRIEGSEFPDQWVVLGNHIDAWTYGGVDPNSGTTALMEVARALGTLLERGIRPRRTLILAGWDGEEYGLIGSTEWGEHFRDELTEKAVAYINVDSAVSGKRFSASSVPSLYTLIEQVTRQVTDPHTGLSLYDAWLERENEKAKEKLDRPPIGKLGSGSDYTVFLDHLGIPSMNLSFQGPYGVYHSVLDNHQWMARFGDPAWQYHPTMARLWSRLAWRLANADLVPFDFSDYGTQIGSYLQELQKQSEKVAGLNIDWSPLIEEAGKMEELGDQIIEGFHEVLEDDNAARFNRINGLLISAEREFLIDGGLPDREWFRHAIYAPGYYTGYASKPLPGPSQAIDDNELVLARQQAAEVLARLRSVNQILDQIRRLTR